MQLLLLTLLPQLRLMLRLLLLLTLLPLPLLMQSLLAPQLQLQKPQRPLLLQLLLLAPRRHLPRPLHLFQRRLLLPTSFRV